MKSSMAADDLKQLQLKTEADAAASLEPAGDVGRGRAQGR
jgi:hypothetical protein